MNGMFFLPAGSGTPFQMPTPKRQPKKSVKRTTTTTKVVNPNVEELKELGTMGMDEGPPDPTP